MRWALMVGRVDPSINPSPFVFPPSFLFSFFLSFLFGTAFCISFLFLFWCGIVLYMYA